MTEKQPQTPTDSPFRKAFYSGLVLQSIFIILAALILDGGNTLRIVAIFAIPYFGMVVWIGYKRSEKPTSGDLFFIQFVPLFSFIVAFYAGWLMPFIYFVV